jgi:hypothetical protein
MHLGADIAFYNAKTKLDGVTVVSSNLIDNEDDIFDMHTKLIKYSETQRAMFLNIPIMLHVQANKFYALGGIKIGVPLTCKSKTTDATINNKGYFPEQDNWLTMPEFQGFGTFSNISSEAKLPFQLAATLALETGLKYNIGNNFALFVGVYFDYSLNNVVKKGNHPFINYSASDPEYFKTNSAIPTFSKKMHLMALGFKLRFAFIK